MSHMSPDSAAGGAGSVGSFMGLMTSAKEKWDSSGANEAMGRVSASIPDSTKQYVGTMFRRDQLRSPSIFFGIGEERGFYVEKNVALLVERVRHNVTFFYLNYFLMTILLFCLTVITSPTTLILVGIWAAGCMWFIRASSNGTLALGSVQIPQKTAAVGLGIVSVFYLMWVFQNVFWWTLFSSGFLVLMHALFRDASMHKDMEDAVPMEGDLNEDAAFLNA